MIPVFIINHDRLTLPKNMADYLAGCKDVYPIIVDNASTYEPLLEYYKTCPHKVIRLHLNFGNCVMWNTGILDEMDLHGDYIVTDPDLDLSKIPTDFIDVLREGLRRYPDIDKCGFSLEINDLPENGLKQQVLEWESGQWHNKIDEMYYRAAIDTTFALYRSRIHSFNCLRTDRPYTAKHVPWYYTNDNIPADEMYYLTHCNETSSYGKKILKLL